MLENTDVTAPTRAVCNFLISTHVEVEVELELEEDGFDSDMMITRGWLTQLHADSAGIKLIIK